jgi:hypothetical protein
MMMNQVSSPPTHGNVNVPAGRQNSYTHYSPAVRLGHSLAVLEQYYNKSWAEIEPSARRRWAEEHDRPFEEFEEVVRRAWAVASREFSEQVEPLEMTTDYDELFHRHYQETYSDSPISFRQYIPAYYYGFDLGVDRRLQNKNWAEIEPEARRYWNEQSEAGSWDDVKEAVYYAWNEVRDRNKR